jgi:hypothetical protein
MIDLTKLSLNELKMIIKEYKNYISLKLIGLQKDDLIKLINKFNITLSNDDNKKIKKAIEKKEAKLNIPKILTPAEKEAKERKIEKQKIKNKQLIKEWAQKEADKEIEQLKKEGKYEYEKPKKEKVEFNFTALYIPTKLKRDEYSKEQLNSLYGDYEESFTDEKMNNIAKIMKENDKYKYVYDRFIEFVKYFKDVDIDKYINDLINYDFEYFEMPQVKRSRLPFFSSKIYLKTVNKTMSHDDYANYIKKAIEDIKTELKIEPTTEPKVKEPNNQDKIKKLQDELKTLRVEYYAKFLAEETSRALTNKRKKWSGGESPQEYKQRYEKKQLLLKNMGIDTENLKSKTEWIKSQKEPKPKKEPKVKVVKEPKPPKPTKEPKPKKNLTVKKLSEIYKKEKEEYYKEKKTKLYGDQIGNLSYDTDKINIHRSILGLDDFLTGKSILNKIVEWMEIYPTVYERFKLWVNQQYKTKKNININQIISEDKNYNIKPTKRKPFFSVNFITTIINNYGYKLLYEGIKKAILDIEPQLTKYILSIDDIKQSEKTKKKDIKEPIKTSLSNEDNKKIKNEWFTKKRRDELLLLRKKNPLIGDIINNNITHYEKLILPNNGRQLNNNIKFYNPKKYKLLTEYINSDVERNEKQQKMKKGVLRDTKINILRFIDNQIEQQTGPHLFYPPYLQNYIALNGLYIVYRFFEILFKSINKNIIIVPKTNDEINKFENEKYPYLKKLSLNEKTSIRTKYHNFLYDDYKVYDDYYLTYYSKN